MPEGEKIAGFGFTLPYLPLFANNNSEISLTPGALGAENLNSPVNMALCVEDMLPLKNEYFDKILVAHGFENIDNDEALMQEFWRVLKPGGKLLVIAANDDSFWRKTATPFAKGKGLTHFRLLELAMGSKFFSRGFDRALFFPPSSNAFLNLFLERAIGLVCRAASGVMVIEMEKIIFVPRGRTSKVTPSLIERIFKPKAATVRAWQKS